jgi:hypothetical protein
LVLVVLNYFPCYFVVWNEEVDFENHMKPLEVDSYLG